jgi:peptide/nickel transport system ATP-binding protein
MALPACEATPPPAVEVATGEYVRCIRAEEVRSSAVTRGRELLRLVQPVDPDNGVILAAHDVNAFYGTRQILSSITFELRPGECLALVGESGSGKTTLARALVGVPVKRTGEILYRGTAVAVDAQRRPAAVRQRIQYVFQSPYSSLNPRQTVGQIISVPLRHFFGTSRREAASRVEGSLESVSLPGRYASYYPDQLSGGERQRVALARALVCEPEVIICDEITSSLDVSVQAAIVTLLRRLQEAHDLALLFVTHNLALVRSIADRVMVIERGVIVESGYCDAVLDRPSEPSTRRLVEHTPTLERAAASPTNVATVNAHNS